MTLREIRRFRRALRRFHRATNFQLRGCCSNVTLAQCLVLLEIDEHGRSAVGRLALELGLDNSTLSRTIDGLVRAGLASRQRDDTDRRVVWIELTPRGVAECRALHEDNDACCREVFRKIAPERRDAVVENFEVLVQAYLDVEAAERPGSRVTATTPALERRAHGRATR